MKIKDGIYLALAVALSSCSHSYYMPTTQSVPLFKEKGELQVNACLINDRFSSINNPDSYTATELQAAYSITSKFAVMANGALSRTGLQQNDKDWMRSSYMEGALGYYRPLAENLRFETYAGAGVNRQHHHYMGNNVSLGTSDLLYAKVFVQPNIGYTNNIFDIALSTRLGLVDYHILNNNTAGSSIHELDIVNLRKGSPMVMLEPAITMRVGWKWAKFQLQLAHTLNLTGSAVNLTPFTVSLGANFTLWGRYKAAPKYTSDGRAIGKE